jgi:hypothetical protein
MFDSSPPPPPPPPPDRAEPPAIGVRRCPLGGRHGEHDMLELAPDAHGNRRRHLICRRGCGLEMVVAFGLLEGQIRSQPA